jgi:hypothetical protein
MSRMTHTSTTELTYCFLPLITFTFANDFVNTTAIWLANLWQLASYYRTAKIRMRLKAVLFRKNVIGKPVIEGNSLQDYQNAYEVEGRFNY